MREEKEHTLVALGVVELLPQSFISDQHYVVGSENRWGDILFRCSRIVLHKKKEGVKNILYC